MKNEEFRCASMPQGNSSFFILHFIIQYSYRIRQQPTDGNRPPDARYPDGRNGGEYIGKHDAGT